MNRSFNKEAIPSRMTRPIVYVFVILVLSLFEGYCKKYLVETEDGKHYIAKLSKAA